MLSVDFFCYAECHYAECRYAECRGATPHTHEQLRRPGTRSTTKPRIPL
jgi:hypothetical protein